MTSQIMLGTGINGMSALGTSTSKRKLTGNQDWTECGSLQAGRLEDEEFAQEVSSRKDIRG
jgi:hypothetical protein